MTDINKTIGLRLRALRLSKGISIDDMAAALKVKSNTVTRIENSTSQITVPMLVAAAQRLGVLVSMVIGEIPANEPYEANNE